MNQGKYPKELKENLAVNILARCLSAARYGIEEAHGKGATAELNWFMENGAFIYDASTGKFKVDFEKFDAAVTSLTKEILEIEATGDTARAEKLFKKYAVVPSFLQKTIDKVKDKPVDIIPVYNVRNLESAEQTLLITQENRDYVEGRLKNYEVVNIPFDASKLPAEDQKVLKILLQVGDIMGQVYRRQLDSGGEEILRQLQASKNPADKKILNLFLKNQSGYDAANGSNTAFIGTKPCPPGRNFYPEDITKEELDAWVKNHPEDAKYFESPYTVIRREGNKLIAVPYTVEYEDLLAKAADLLSQAAEASTNESLKKYLSSLARAFKAESFEKFKQDHPDIPQANIKRAYYDYEHERFDKLYLESHMAWMDLDSNLDVTIGPHEVYCDPFEKKAGFACYIAQNEASDEKRLNNFKAWLPEIDKNLPMDPAYKESEYFQKKYASPIRYIRSIIHSGDALPLTAIAFMLPNDERVWGVKGAKKVMLKSIMEAGSVKAKDKAKAFIDPSQVDFIDKDSENDWTLFHELAHGLGPVYVDGVEPKKSVRESLGDDLYLPTEELKADLAGLYNLFYLISTNRYPKEAKKKLMVNFLVRGIMASRYGTKQAHGKGAVAMFNFFMEKGAFEYDASTEFFKVNFDKFEAALTSLTEKILRIEKDGDAKAAQEFFDTYAKEVSPNVQKALDKTKDMPFDVITTFEVKNLK